MRPASRATDATVRSRLKGPGQPSGPERGNELPAGEIGTVYVERDQLPFRYHNDLAKTREAQHPEHENWTTTGDVGYIDDDGTSTSPTARPS